MHYSPYLPIEISSNFDRAKPSKDAAKAKPYRKKAEHDRMESELAEKRAQLAEADSLLEAKLRKVTERLVDDVFDTRETQHRLLQQQAAETHQLNEQKQKLSIAKQQLASEKRKLSQQNDALQARTFKQEEENRKLKEKLRKAQQEAEKAKRETEKVKAKVSHLDSLKCMLHSILGKQVGGPDELSGPTTDFGKTTRILDLD